MDREQRAGLQYFAELSGTMILYIASLFARRPLENLNPSAAWHGFVLLSPSVPIWLVFWVIVRHYRRMDEYLRLQLLQIVAVCAGIAACLTSSYGFARDAFDLPPVAIGFAWPVMAACWVAATLIVQFRNRRSVTCTTS